MIDLLAELKLPFSNDSFKQFPVNPDQRDTPLGLDFNEFETVILGAVIHGVMQKFGDIEQPEKLLDGDDGEAFSKVLLSSAKLGAQAFEASMKEADKAMQSLMKSFK